MKANIIKDFNLPPYVKGKSFAEASKAIEAKFADRKDQTAAQTKEELLQRLAKAQEYIKMQESLKTNATEVPDMMEGQIPEGMEEFAYGGNMYEEGGDLLSKTGGATAGDYVGMATTAFDLGQGLFAHNQIDTSGQQTYEEKSELGGAATGAMKGAQAGAALGPWGAAVGGVLGGAAGLFGAKSQNKKIETANRRAHLGSAFKMGRTSDFAKGGNMGIVDPVKLQTELNRQKGLMDDTFKVTNPLFANTPVFSDPTLPAVDPLTKARPEAESGFKNFVKDNYGEAMRLAPIIGNLTEKLEKPTTEQATRIKGRYAKNPIDMNYLTRQVNQSTNEQAMASELSGGSLGAARNMATALNLNKQKALSDAAFQGQNAARDENRFAAQIDRQADMFNAQQDERYVDRKARDEGAYNTAKSMKRAALTESIANLGRELSDKKTVKQMFGYKWNGKYWVDKKGNKYTNEEVTEAKKNLEAKKEDSNSKMFGGYVKKK